MAFLPLYDGTAWCPDTENNVCFSHKWAKFTNMKAVQMGAGVQGGCYPSFVPFTYNEIERFIGLYILQGLNPSPQVEMKFSSRRADPVQGSDLCHGDFGDNAIKWHKQFKAFFSLQDPTKPASTRKECPTYKVDSYKFHNCWFNNLYLSARFAKAAWTHSNKVRISGPTRKSGHGLPKCVIQEEVKNAEAIHAVWGTVKAAVLEGDYEVPGLLAVSYYDQKCLSTVCEKIKWVQCEKKVYCVETEQVETMTSLWLSINNEYNYGMGGVDIADQLRNYYRFDHWMHKRK